MIVHVFVSIIVCMKVHRTVSYIEIHDTFKTLGSGRFYVFICFHCILTVCNISYFPFWF